jgi:hypothetical protein
LAYYTIEFRVWNREEKRREEYIGLEIWGIESGDLVGWPWFLYKWR